MLDAWGSGAILIYRRAIRHVMNTTWEPPSTAKEATEQLHGMGITSTSMHVSSKMCPGPSDDFIKKHCETDLFYGSITYGDGRGMRWGSPKTAMTALFDFDLPGQIIVNYTSHQQCIQLWKGAVLEEIEAGIDAGKIPKKLADRYDMRGKGSRYRTMWEMEKDRTGTS